MCLIEKQQIYMYECKALSRHTAQSFVHDIPFEWKITLLSLLHRLGYVKRNKQSLFYDYGTICINRQNV